MNNNINIQKITKRNKNGKNISASAIINMIKIKNFIYN